MYLKEELDGTSRPVPFLFDRNFLSNKNTLREDAHDAQIVYVASRLRVSARVREANSLF